MVNFKSKWQRLSGFKKVLFVILAPVLAFFVVFGWLIDYLSDMLDTAEEFMAGPNDA